MTEPAKMIEQIKNAGFTFRGIASNIGASESLIYKLSSRETVKVAPDTWERLKKLYQSLTEAGVIK